MAKSWKEWEKPLIDLDESLSKLKELAARESDAIKRKDIVERIAQFEQRRDNYIDIMYSRLGPWEKVLVARADPRPYTLDYVSALFTDFVELQGDRRYGPDHAIVGGPAMFDGVPCMVIGHQKGRNIQERQLRNFAMAKPEGYRKAIRLMDMAGRFNLPLITFIDTPAADPGVDSESRGISEAIASAMYKTFELEVPVISVVIGEGGSGGAIAIGAANRILMQEHAIYSVIPPEGCAAILWRDPAKNAQAAAALKLTAQSALELGIIDEIVGEPKGGAHRDSAKAGELVRECLKRHLDELRKLKPEELRTARYDKFRRIGVFSEGADQVAAEIS